MDTISSNLANANTVAPTEAQAYRKRSVILTATEGGVKIDGVESDDQRPLLRKVDWSHPFHNRATGEVIMSNVDPIGEMVDMISASRAYEANISAFNTVKGMMNSALQIGKA